MAKIKVKYRDLRGWKYLVEERVCYPTTFKNYDTKIFYKDEVLVHLMPDGNLIVYPGYAWDGPSGPTWDTPDWMDASLVHDIFYQFLRASQMPTPPSDKGREKLRKKADLLMYDMLIEAGMPWFRACYSYHGVRCFAAWAANPNFQI